MASDSVPRSPNTRTTASALATRAYHGQVRATHVSAVVDPHGGVTSTVTGGTTMSRPNESAPPAGDVADLTGADQGKNLLARWRYGVIAVGLGIAGLSGTFTVALLTINR